MNQEFNTVHFETLGCKLNQIESEAAAKAFSDSGFSVDVTPCTASFSGNSSVFLCIVNTCTVTGMSDKKSRQIIRRAKQINPNSVVCAVGCYIQVAKEDVEKIEDVDIILGTVEKKDLFN